MITGWGILTAEEAREISFANNDKIKSVLDQIRKLANEGKTQTDWIVLDWDSYRLLSHLDYSVKTIESKENVKCLISW